MNVTSGEKINVLLVDDRPENLVALDALLSSKYVSLYKCDSGEAALRQILREDFALILLDVQMPGIDGYETAKLIKARDRSRHTPIIFITAINQDPEHVHFGYTLGAIDYIFKPFDPDVLKSKVDSFIEMHLNGKRLLEQTKLLNEKTKELELANGRLLRLASDLQRAEAMAKVIGETSLDTMITFDDQGVVTSVNPAVRRMFGYAQEELLGSSVERLFRQSIFQEYLQDADGGDRRGHIFELEALASGGVSFPAEIQIHKTQVEERLLYACTIRDITERKAQMAKLRYMAMHDTLTGLPNRTRLYEEIRSLQGKPFALLMFDLNHFKTINDTLGHSYGDEFLRTISRELRSLEHQGALVARLGGDEFAALLPSVGSEESADVARTIVQSIEQPRVIHGVTLAVGVSMGIALSPEHGEEPDELMRCVDVAMYQAKRRGMDFALYDRQSDENDPYYLTLMGDLRGAIEKGQFRLHYQPKIRLRTGELTGVEALIRWEHPEHGMIAPSDFIPLAEQVGMIHPLTCWVLEEAIRQCKEWESRGVDLSVAVNLSVRSLQDQDFPELVSRLLRSYDLKECKLQLEITESFLMTDTIRAMVILEELKSRGVKLAIDDFGTGFSSLAYLKQLPVSQVKIDKSFVLQMADDNDNAVIVRSIIQLAHNLRMGVVAEGVEDERAWNTLLDWGCDEAQGFHISRPLPADPLERWLQSECDGSRWK